MTSALRPRSLWHRITLGIQAAWAATLLLVLALQTVLPEPRWYLVHTAGLGFVASAILVWTWHFADALTRRKQSQKHQLARLVLMAAGAVQLGIAIAGAGIAGQALALTGPATVIGAMAWHLWALHTATKGGFLGRAAATLRFHATAGAFLILGATFGTLLAVDATNDSLASLWRKAVRLHHDDLVLAHAMWMLLGFVGLTILGTLVTFGPTIARARMSPKAVEWSRRALPPLAGAVCGGALLAAGGFARLAGVAVLVWMAASALILVPVAQSWRGSMLSVGDGWFVGAGMTWILAAAATWAVQLLTAGVDAGSAGYVKYGMLIGAGAVQTVIGALTFLLPVVMGGGPTRLRRTLEKVEPSAAARWFLINGGMLVAVLTRSERTQRAALTLAVIAAAASLLLVAVLSLRQKTAGAPEPEAGPRQSERRRVEGADGEPARKAGERAVPQEPGKAAGEQKAGLPVGLPRTDAVSPRSGEAGSSPARDPRGHPRAMPRTRLSLGAALAALALVVAVAWGGNGGSPGGGGQAGGAVSDPGAEVTKVRIAVRGLSFTPSRIEVPRGNRLQIAVRNTSDQQHDLVVDNGAATGMIDPGKSRTVDVGVVNGNMGGWCSVVGHRQAGMTVTIVAVGKDRAGSASPSPGRTPASGGGHDHGGIPGTSRSPLQPTYAELSAEPGPSFAARDATVPPASAETTHRIVLEAVEVDKEVAPGRKQRVWTFNGTVPGPVLRGKVGDAFVVTLTNKGTMGHSIDFHAGDVSPDQPMRTIAPGQSLTYTFTARRSGIWLYHCSTKPLSTHIANGMHGAVIVDPPGLDRVDREYYLIQAEQYWSANLKQGTDADAVRSATPSAVAFNGYPFQYVHRPLQARTGERVRIWVISAGPNLDLPFHVVGAQFDTVWYEGAYRIRRGCDVSSLAAQRCDPAQGSAGSAGSQGLAVAVAQGGFVEFAPREPGTYTPLNHAMAYAERGATASLRVTSGSEADGARGG